MEARLLLSNGLAIPAYRWSFHHLCSSCPEAKGLKLLGRCFYLKSAYRQLPIHLDDLPFAAVSVWSAEDQCARVLQMFALPFWAGGSVPGFVRVSLGLWRVLCRLDLVPAALFFDDYTCIVLEPDAANAEASVHLLFRILALVGDNAASFASTFQSLGVLFCLHPGVDRHLSVANTEVRIAEVAAWCLEKLRCLVATPKECEPFASRMRWLAGQVVFWPHVSAAPRTACCRKGVQASHCAAHFC